MTFRAASSLSLATAKKITIPSIAKDQWLLQLRKLQTSICQRLAQQGKWDTNVFPSPSQLLSRILLHNKTVEVNEQKCSTRKLQQSSLQTKKLNHFLSRTYLNNQNLIKHWICVWKVATSCCLHNRTRMIGVSAKNQLIVSLDQFSFPLTALEIPLGPNLSQSRHIVLLARATEVLQLFVSFLPFFVFFSFSEGFYCFSHSEFELKHSTRFNWATTKKIKLT